MGQDHGETEAHLDMGILYVLIRVASGPKTWRLLYKDTHMSWGLHSLLLARTPSCHGQPDPEHGPFIWDPLALDLNQAPMPSHDFPGNGQAQVGALRARLAPNLKSLHHCW
jgi:hypothetical protein